MAQPYRSSWPWSIGWPARRRPRMSAKAEDAGPLDLGILKLARHRHGIFYRAFEPVERQIGPARVADEDGRAAAGEADEPIRRRLRQVFLVGDVAREHHVPALVGADEALE